MAKKSINSQSAPILWSTVDQAFTDINDNFNELYATIGGGSIVDFTDLGTSLIPNSTQVYDLGSSGKKWRDIWIGSTGLHLGNAVITSTGTSVNLPAGSTVGGVVLDSEYFKEIAVSGEDNIVAAPGGADVLNIASLTGIGITTNNISGTITFANTGVTSIVTGTGISVSNDGVGDVTIGNTGVTEVTAGAGISVTNDGVGDITIANSGIISVVTDPGSGISLDTSVPNTVRITNSAPNITQNTFRTIAVAGQDSIVADTSTDTLTLVAGTGIAITTNETTDTVTISSGGSQSTVTCDPGVDTVIYSTSSPAATIKLVVQIEGDDGSDGNWHTQSCDMIVVSRYNGSTRVVDDSVYGIVHTSVSPIATLSSQYNGTTFEIEITATPVSVTNSIYVKSFVVELITSAP